MKQYRVREKVGSPLQPYPGNYLNQSINILFTKLKDLVYSQVNLQERNIFIYLSCYKEICFARELKNQRVCVHCTISVFHVLDYLKPKLSILSYLSSTNPPLGTGRGGWETTSPPSRESVNWINLLNVSFFSLFIMR